MRTKELSMPTEDGQRIPHAGVNFPPPLYFALGFLAGWLLHRLLPLSVPGGSGIGAIGGMRAVGWLLIAVGVLLLIWAQMTFRRHRTTVIPRRPAAAMVTDGPYHFTRNPMYVSFTLIYAGAALVERMLWPIILLPIVLVLLTTFVIRREERYLADAFGVEYAAFREKVRRWL
jgi:protein-S-isoprenylcysteine O-methyltransferase Ste14